MTTAESIASSAVKTAIDVEAKVIIVCSESGATARQIAKFRPGMPIVVLTRNATTARQCYGVVKGATIRTLPCIADTDAVVKSVTEELVSSGDCVRADPVVIVHGASANIGATNTMKIVYC